MPAYRYRAVHPSGRIHHGEMTVVNEHELIRFLGESGLELLDARPPAPGPVRRLAAGRLSRPGLRERVLLCRQLASLLRAGLPFMDAFQGITEALPPDRWRNTLEAIARDVNQGSSIAAAFGRYPVLFGTVFRALLKTGEVGGNLAATFDRLADYTERQAAFRERLNRALRYPLFLVTVALGVTIFMVTSVVPQVMEFLGSVAQTLPLSTRLLVALSTLAAKGWWLVLLAVLAASFILFVARGRSPAFAQQSDGWALSLPGLGRVLRQLALARFSDGFALLLQSGADLPLALDTAKDVLGNRALVAAAAEANRRLQDGESLSSALSLLFPRAVTQRIRVGEKSGRLVETLIDVARVYDDETKLAVDAFIGALEPALTILVGGLLGWVVLAVLGPVYGSLGKLDMGF